METQGIHGTGKTNWKPYEYNIVCALVRATRVPITVGTIAAVTGLKGNTIRAILSHADGREFVLGGGNKGYVVASTHMEAQAMDNRLFSQIAAMTDRVNRRRKWKYSST